MLHTIVAEEFIWGGTEAQPQCVCIRGGYLEGVREGDCLVVSRLISTDPALYLDPRYAPGARYRYTEDGTEKTKRPGGNHPSGA
ncbi:MAG: YlzJ-like family protein [Oscillospiraceae bacterium]|nr:YlzJ-like family protein [Oscillospiraceae bacterium]